MATCGAHGSYCGLDPGLAGERRGTSEISPFEVSGRTPTAHPIAREIGSLANLRVVCAWCQVVIEAGAPGAPTSHGMCPKCEQDFVQQIPGLHAQDAPGVGR